MPTFLYLFNLHYPRLVTSKNYVFKLVSVATLPQFAGITLLSSFISTTVSLLLRFNLHITPFNCIYFFNLVFVLFFWTFYLIKCGITLQFSQASHLLLLQYIVCSVGLRIIRYLIIYETLCEFVFQHSVY